MAILQTQNACPQLQSTTTLPPHGPLHGLRPLSKDQQGKSRGSTNESAPGPLPQVRQDIPGQVPRRRRDLHLRPPEYPGDQHHRVQQLPRESTETTGQ